jgi:hypothetical protein
MISGSIFSFPAIVSTQHAVDTHLHHDCARRSVMRFSARKSGGAFQSRIPAIPHTIYPPLKITNSRLFDGICN